MIPQRVEQDKAIFEEFIRKFEIAIKTKSIYQNEEMFYEFAKFFYDTIYDSIHNYIENNKDKETEELAKKYCDYIIKRILPVCSHKLRKLGKSEDVATQKYLSLWLELEDNFFALASYRNLKYFAYYIERGNSKKIWRDTMQIFEPFFYYAQKMIFREEVVKIRASYFPGAGKTYAMNLICAYWFGYDNEISILRITYSDDLCKSFIKQIGGIIDSKQYRKVFPKFNKGEKVGDDELYTSYSIAIGFQFKFSKVHNFYSSSRGGQITGKRGRVLMTDDLLKGSEEAYDFKIQSDMQNRYDTDWNSRADDDTQLEIHAGTMWGEQDLLNVIETREKKRNKFVYDNKHKYTKFTVDTKGKISSVYIAVPILDYETDESTCPLRYSTEKMRQKREDFKDKSLFESVYQQNPQPQEGMIFSYKKLEQYNEDNILEPILQNKGECIAFLDPARKGKNYVALGIFKRCMVKKKYTKWYLVDCIYKKDLIENLLPTIINKIFLHNVDIFGYESNTDTSLKVSIKQALNKIGYSEKVKIEDYYTIENKETKISNARNGILYEIIYPQEGMYSITSDMGLGMFHLTTYNFEKKVDYDDFPDMVSMFVKYYCEEKKKNSIKVLKRNEFNIR